MADRMFSIRTQSNDSIAKYFDKRATFVVMLGGCSCDLYAAETNSRAAATLKEQDAARKKYAKLGWSASKIERALAARHTSADRARGFIGLRQDVRDVIGGLAEAAGEVGLLIHDYSGEFDEEIVVARQARVSTPDDLRTGAMSTAEDVVLWIRP